MTLEQWYSSGGVLSNTVTYTYDSSNELTQVTDSSATLGFGYDSGGRLTSANTSGGGTGQPNVTLTYGYDALNKLTSMTDSLGTSGVTSYGYDSAQRLTTIARSIGGSTVAVVGLTYDAASRVTAISRTQSGSGTNVASSLAYDSADRVTTLTHQVSGGSVLDSFVYGYDSGGRLRTETNTEGLATYGYDAANQLTSVTRPAGQTNESYSYDSGGNRTMTGYTTGVGNELLASPGATYAYDAEGNLAAKTETSTGNVWSYTYDIRNRMTGVTEKNSGGTVIYQASYTYDALDRRIATNVNGTTTWTVYDGQNTYADFSGAGALKMRYLYGPAIDELFARTDSSGTTAWYLTDRLGSVRDLASTSGAALDHLAYDAYGNIVSESQPSNGDRFKWTAREWDGTTGLQFNRHRYYAPSVGRWTQLDPRGLSATDSELYGYCRNSPGSANDPQGLEPYNQFVGAMYGGTATVLSIAPFVPPTPYSTLIYGGAFLVGAATAWYGTSGQGNTYYAAIQGVFYGIVAGLVVTEYALAPVTYLAWQVAYRPSRLSPPLYQPSITNPPGTYRPGTSLPRGPNGEMLPSSPYPHTQIGTELGRKVGPYTTAREYGPNGLPIRDIHFTDHGRPNVPGHTNPHQHWHLPSLTGGTPEYGPPEPFFP